MIVFFAYVQDGLSSGDLEEFAEKMAMEDNDQPLLEQDGTRHTAHTDQRKAPWE